MSVTAGTVINRVRAQIPDAVYDSSGNPAPGTDGGLFRAVDLYQWLDDGIKNLTQRIGWSVEDWISFGATSGVPFYVVNSQWLALDLAYRNGWLQSRIDEFYTIWPTGNLSAGQSQWWSIHRATDHFEITFFPTPSVTDPTTTLASTVNIDSVTINVTTSNGFLPFGYVLIDSEQMYYGSVSANGASAVLKSVVRGTGVTSANTHNNAVTVSHQALWVKGGRLPNAVATATDTVELPAQMLIPLQWYVLARCRAAEQEFQESSRLMNDYEKWCQNYMADPRTKFHQGAQAKAYGSEPFAGLYFGRLIMPTVAALMVLFL